MNSKIKFSIFGILTIVSAFIISTFSDNYYGVPFEYDLVCLIFTLIEFSCVCTVCKINESSLICNEYKAIRYKKRSSIIKFEIQKRIFYILLLTTSNSLTIATIKKLSIKYFILLIALNFLTFLFLALVQFFLELKFTSDTGYLVVIVGYVISLFIGIMLQNYSESHSNIASKLFEVVNKFNIVNYSSLTRINLLGCNIKLSIFLLMVLNIMTVSVLLLTLKKSDIMERNQ